MTEHENRTATVDAQTCDSNAAPPERDARGRFAPGNPGGPGNPYARQTAAYRKLLRDVVTEDHLREVAEMLVAKARAGDLAAAKLILQYIIGKPAEVGDPDRVDIDEARFWRDNAISPGVINEAIERTPAPLASTILREMAPVTAHQQIQVLKNAVLDPDAWYQQQAERRREAEFDREWGGSAWDAEMEDMFGPGRRANGPNGPASASPRPHGAAGQRRPDSKQRRSPKQR